MSITINGTSGISGVDGSASTPALQGTDTNTGVFFGTDTVTIATGGTAAVTVDSGQRTKFPTTIGVGGATPSTSGSGVSFPATQSASTDANTLDDYEEGTWTPNLTASSGTLTTVVNGTGNYTKVGNAVTVTCRPSITTNGTGASALKVAGLPFAIGKNSFAGASREDGAAGNTFGISQFDTTTLYLQKYDSTYPGGSGYAFPISITYLI